MLRLALSKCGGQHWLAGTQVVDLRLRDWADQNVALIRSVYTAVHYCLKTSTIHFVGRSVSVDAFILSARVQVLIVH